MSDGHRRAGGRARRPGSHRPRSRREPLRQPAGRDGDGPAREEESIAGASATRWSIPSAARDGEPLRDRARNATGRQRSAATTAPGRARGPAPSGGPRRRRPAAARAPAPRPGDHLRPATRGRGPPGSAARRPGRSRRPTGPEPRPARRSWGPTRGCVGTRRRSAASGAGERPSRVAVEQDELSSDEGRAGAGQPRGEARPAQDRRRRGDEEGNARARRRSPTPAAVTAPPRAAPPGG
ncbi:MAG: hypothetical protein MZV64_14625 [Ignavibacteriales bacterium]|nr:hypothetical protein [Ignavibacteriales bacterium]